MELEKKGHLFLNISFDLLWVPSLAILHLQQYTFGSIFSLSFQATIKHKGTTFSEQLYPLCFFFFFFFFFSIKKKETLRSGAKMETHTRNKADQDASLHLPGSLTIFSMNKIMRINQDDPIFDPQSIEEWLGLRNLQNSVSAWAALPFSQVVMLEPPAFCEFLQGSGASFFPAKVQCKYDFCNDASWCLFRNAAKLSRTEYTL